MAITETTKPFYTIAIPEDWELKRLGDICQIKGRIGYRGYTVDDIVPEGEGAITISPSNFKNGYLDYSNSTYISWFKYDESPEIQLANNDILLVKTGSTFGKSALVNNLTEKATINPQIIVIKNVKTDVKFLSYIIADNIIQKQINTVVVGGAIPTLSQENILNFTFPLPPLQEQGVIAHILSLMDTAINKNNQLIDQKELRKKWLMQNLLTGKKRLMGFDGEWKEYRLGDVTTNFSRRNKDLIEAKIYSVTNTNGFVLQSEHFEGKIAGDDLSGYKIIKTHEFAYNPARINVGSLAYFENEIGVISSLYVCFKTKKEILDYYLHQFLKIDHTKYRIETLGEGGVRVYLWYELFSKIKIKLPSLEEQTAIAQVLQAADKEIQLLKAKTDKLRKQKKGMMQVLLTGKKRLKV